MKVLINPKIVLNKSKNKGIYSYSIELMKKDLHNLTIRAISHNKKDKRIVGVVDRNGELKLKANRFSDVFYSIYGMQTRQAVETTLDLVFGTKRDKLPKLNKNGYVEFRRG